MVRSLIVVAVLLALCAPAPPLRGAACGLDDNPAATLLLPYFEVDLASLNGATTMFSINNASDLGILSQVTLWTDLGVPTLQFNVYLTGFDVQTINLRDVFNGRLPRTASDGQDPLDTLSPQGLRSQDVNFASCGTSLPGPESLPANVGIHLRAAHTGQFSATLNGCAGQSFADGIARGYVTVDTVSRCDVLYPSSPGYFGPGGVATNQNVLWGDYYLVDPANNFSAGENLVRLEADPQALHSGDATFYGRYTHNDASDAREPLPSTWATRYVSGGAFTGGTQLLVWRSSTVATSAFACLQKPSWYPLGLETFLFFNEEEMGDGFFPFPGLPPPGPFFPVFPAEANRVKLDSSEIPLPFDFGWAQIDFGQDSSVRPATQVYVATLMSADGRFLAGFGATPLSEACRPAQLPPPPPGR